MSLHYLDIVFLYAILALCGFCHVDAQLPEKECSNAPEDVSETVKVKTNTGWVAGFQSVVHDKKLDHFFGIPYAQPPVGALRFKKTEPVQPWAGIIRAKSFGKGCLQRYNAVSFVRQTEIDEDCLYLNIYAPSMTPGRPLVPVMFWIHGGAYVLGSSDIYNGTNLATKDVIVVTFNYRLDVLGFLSTEDSTMPGNFGLLDQLQALMWVRENIRFFGGDPERITILGESVGSSMVSMFVLSPLTNGLFIGAAMSSGSALSLWSTIHPTQAIKPKVVAHLIGEVVNCSSKHLKSEEFLKCLQSADPEDLIAASATVLKITGVSVFVAPRVENDFGFLPDLPIRLLQSNTIKHVNTMRGFNSHEEANLRVYPHRARPTDFNSVTEAILGDFAFTDRQYYYSQKKEMYLDGTNDETVIKQKMEQFCKEINFIYPVMYEIETYSQRIEDRNHYLYEFNHRPTYSLLDTWVVAAHGDEVAYTFGIEYLMQKDEDKKVRDVMMEMYTNFVKTGNPNDPEVEAIAEWRPYTPNDRIMLSVNTNSTSLIKIDKSLAYQYSTIVQMIDTDYPSGLPEET